MLQEQKNSSRGAGARPGYFKIGPADHSAVSVIRTCAAGTGLLTKPSGPLACSGGAGLLPSHLPVEQFTNLETGDERSACLQGSWKERSSAIRTWSPQHQDYFTCQFWGGRDQWKCQVPCSLSATWRASAWTSCPRWCHLQAGVWREHIKEFVPYYSNIVFDSDVRFRNIRWYKGSAAMKKNGMRLLKVRAEGGLSRKLWWPPALPAWLSKCAMPAVLSIYWSSLGWENPLPDAWPPQSGNNPVHGEVPLPVISCPPRQPLRCGPAICNHLPIMDDTAQVMEV